MNFGLIMIDPFSNTKNHSSNEPLLIDADSRVASLNSLKSFISALGFLHETIAKGTATIGIRHNTLAISRAELSQLEKFLGAKEDLEQEEELRNNLLRQANIEIRRLQEEMGKGVTIEAIGNKLYQLDQTIYNWWQNLGFSFSQSNLKSYSNGTSFLVDFTCSIDRHIHSMESKPVTAKTRLDAKHETLKNDLEIIYHGREPYVLDTPENRKWFVDKFKERFPNCRIYKWESHSCPNSDVFQIRKVEVNINITDVGDVFEKNERYE
jgi:hypothetical protein